MDGELGAGVAAGLGHRAGNGLGSTGGSPEATELLAEQANRA